MQQKSIINYTALLRWKSICKCWESARSPELPTLSCHSLGLRAPVLHVLGTPTQDWAPQARGVPAQLSRDMPWRSQGCVPGSRENQDTPVQSQGLISPNDMISSSSPGTALESRTCSDAVPRLRLPVSWLVSPALGVHTTLECPHQSQGEHLCKQGTCHPLSRKVNVRDNRWCASPSEVDQVSWDLSGRHLLVA